MTVDAEGKVSLLANDVGTYNISVYLKDTNNYEWAEQPSEPGTPAVANISLSWTVEDAAESLVWLIVTLSVILVAEIVLLAVAIRRGKKNNGDGGTDEDDGGDGGNGDGEETPAAGAAGEESAGAAGEAPAGEEPAGAAGEVGHLLPHLGPDHLGHKVSDGPGCIEFAGRTCALQLFQNGLVDLAEGVAFRIIVQLEIVNRIDDLTQQDAVLHVVVGLGKHSLDNSLSDGRIGIHRQIFQSREQGVVNEVQKFVSGHLLAVFSGCPVLPAAGLRNDRLIVFIIPFPVRLFGGVYLQKQQPGDLLDALGVAVDAGVVTHDIPQPFDKSR